MQILTRVEDKRINSTNLYVEVSFEEYLSFAQKIIQNNNLQRKRVRTSKTVYSLLKEDLKKGCIMPPLVLATTLSDGDNPKLINEDSLLKHLKEEADKVLILDGLQRTYTLLDAASEIKDNLDDYNNFLKYTLRLEIYIGINKFGILYRMLTLNTGQTPMTIRHQLEMLYKDYLSDENTKIKLVTENSGKKADPYNNIFLFKNMIEGFNSFLNRSELPIDREDLLDNIKVLRNVSEEKVDQDLFCEFLNCYGTVFEKLREATSDRTIDNEDMRELEISNVPFGNSVCKVFSTSQALTGFGSAIGKLQDYNLIKSISDISSIVEELPNDAKTDWFEDLLVNLDKIKNTSKKIGNSQRMYFHYFFRELLNRDGYSFLKLEEAVAEGYKKYYSQS